MKGIDPATDLAERAIRQWQMSGSKIARHDLAKETEVIPAEVRAGGGISTFTVGSVAGFLGAITCLICNIAGALVLGVEPLHLLRIYATILEGRRALDISRDDFFIVAFALHIVTGILYGSAFILTEIPIAVAVLTHVSYGLTVALVTYVLQRDFMYPSQTNAQTKE